MYVPRYVVGNQTRYVGKFWHNTCCADQTNPIPGCIKPGAVRLAQMQAKRGHSAYGQRRAPTQVYTRLGVYAKSPCPACM